MRYDRDKKEYTKIKISYAQQTNEASTTRLKHNCIYQTTKSFETEYRQTHPNYSPYAKKDPKAIKIKENRISLSHLKFIF